MAGVEDSKNVVVQINKLKFTYPGIDGAPPPGAKPLIEDFSLTLGAGDRCLLVGANGAGLSRKSFFQTVWAFSMFTYVMSTILIFAIGMDAFMPCIVGYFDVHHQHGIHTSKLKVVDATKRCL